MQLLWYYGKQIRNPPQNRFIISLGPKILIRVIREIEKEYANETQTTREAIFLLIERLKDAYTSLNNYPSLSRTEPFGQLAFTGPRLVRIINDFKQSLQQQKIPARK